MNTSTTERKPKPKSTKQYAWVFMLLLIQYSLPAIAYDEAWPFHLSKSTIIERSLSPNNYDVSFIINDRPVRHNIPTDIKVEELIEKFKTSVEESQRPLFSQSEILIAQYEITKLPALEKIIRENSPPGVFVTTSGSYAQVYWNPPTAAENTAKEQIAAIENLAVLQYKAGHAEEAISLIQQVIQEKQKVYSLNSQELAQSYWVIALLMRSKNRYAAAQYYYQEVLKIRQKLFGEHSKEVAASYMDLANTCFDASQTDEAHAMLAKAQEAMKNTAFVSATHQNGPRPIPTSIYPNWHDSWKELLASEEERSNGSNIKKSARAAEISALKAMFKLPPDIGAATIFGTAQLPTDIKEIKTITKSFTDGKQTLAKSNEKNEAEAKAVPTLDIALCELTVEDDISQVIYDYAKKYGFDDKKGFGTTWPGIRQQAETLLDGINKVAKDNLSKAIMDDPTLSLKATDDSGEFQFDSVKEGSYFIYCSLITEKEACYWLIPVTIKKGTPTRIDILYENKTVSIWEKNRAAPTSKPLTGKEINK